MAIDLSGTDEFNREINLSKTSLADGTFAFDDLAPGNYSLYAIKSAAPKFLIDQPNPINVQSGVNAG
jgi:hypothetical protein